MKNTVIYLIISLFVYILGVNEVFHVEDEKVETVGLLCVSQGDQEFFSSPDDCTIPRGNNIFEPRNEGLNVAIALQQQIEKRQNNFHCKVTRLFTSISSGFHKKSQPSSSFILSVTGREVLLKTRILQI